MLGLNFMKLNRKISSTILLLLLCEKIFNYSDFHKSKRTMALRFPFASAKIFTVVGKDKESLL